MHDAGSISSDSGTSSHSDSGTSWHTSHASHESHWSAGPSPDQFYIRNQDYPNYYPSGSRGRGGRSPVGTVVMVIGILLPIILLIVIH